MKLSPKLYRAGQIRLQTCHVEVILKMLISAVYINDKEYFHVSNAMRDSSSVSNILLISCFITTLKNIVKSLLAGHYFYKTNILDIESQTESTELLV